MAEIDKVTQENAALVEETTAAAESLSTEADHLKENMGFFNTGAVVSQSRYIAKPSTRSATPTPKAKPSKGLPSPKANSTNEWSDF
jgi:methyl-accepting chemotaxis protein